MHHKKRNYKIGGQRSLFGIKPSRQRENEKYISVPDYILKEWISNLTAGDKIRIARTQNLIPSEITLAYKGWATPETINKVNKYFSISRKDFKFKVA
jgi:hypothetical protein